MPLSHELKRDSDTAETLIKSRLKAIFAQPKWTWQKLVRLPDGTFQLDLREQKVPDLTILDGLPISILDISGFSGIDLAPLRQLPLRRIALREIKGGTLEGLRGLKLAHLDLTGSDFSDLSPIAGMPLESLTLNNVRKITDLAPLRGMPLKSLDAAAAGFRDLLPLAGLPLERLSIEGSWVKNLDGIQKLPVRHINLTDTSIEDLTPLRGVPVKELFLSGCHRLRDLSPLAELPALETLIVPTHISDIAFLKKRPTVKRLSNLPFVKFGWNVSRVTLAADFWKQHGERLARQVPMEKQIEKFRQRLITEGNDAEKVPHWAFDAEGRLNIDLPRELKVSDISELRGVAVTSFSTTSGSLHDLSPLAGAPLRSLTLAWPCGVVDLTPLHGTPLATIFLEHTSVRDISVLRSLPLKSVIIQNSPVADASPLAGIPTLEQVQLPAGVKNIETLRNHPKIKLISYGQPLTPAEFWKEYDAKKTAAPK